MEVWKWDEDIKTMEDGHLAERLHALERLKFWDTFKKEFGWTGIFAITPLIQSECDNRLKAKVKTYLESGGDKTQLVDFCMDNAPWFADTNAVKYWLEYWGYTRPPGGE